MRFSILLAAVMISALGVVYEKYRSRQLFIEIQRLENQLADYDVEWGQLQLEQTTWAGHARIERAARKELRLVLPDRESIVYLKP